MKELSPIIKFSDWAFSNSKREDMKVKCFKINKSLQLEVVPKDQIVELSKQKKEKLWVDLHYTDLNEVKQWFTNLDIKDLGKQLFKTSIDNPAFYPINNEIFMTFPVITIGGKIASIAIICRENLLITIHDKSISDLEQIDLEAGSDSWLFEPTIAALLSAIFMDLSLACLNQANDLKRLVEQAEIKMNTDPSSIQYETILNLRAKQLHLESAVSGQTPSVGGLKVVEKEFFNPANVKDYLNCSEVNLFAARDLLDRIENRIIDLRSRFELNSQEKGNRRLNMLTIISAVFMPITFLAGIWGMNFENMPELNHTYAYPIALSFMAVIVVGMFIFFKKHGWFTE